MSRKSSSSSEESSDPLIVGHVAEFMESLEEEDDERFKKHFSTVSTDSIHSSLDHLTDAHPRQFLADDIGSEDLEDMYKECHAKIREDPVAKLTEKTDLEAWKAASKITHPKKLSLRERRERIEIKKAAFVAGRNAVEEEDDE